MEKHIWTIGHSNKSFDELLGLLREHKLKTLVDIRRFPGSAKYPHFNRENLNLRLTAEGIRYIHLEPLGGRRKPVPDSINKAWRNDAFRGYADYMLTEDFRKVIAMLMKIAGEDNTAIMCSEVLWWRCHRALVSDYLKAAGYEVTHILAPGKAQEHPYTSVARIRDGKLDYTPDQFDIPYSNNAE